MRPLLLDLFCGAGGAAMGYHRAGFDIIGVDHQPQPHYPFTFIRGDATNPPVRLEQFDAIHASPPCQEHSTLNALPQVNHDTGWMLDATAELLRSTGLPWVIENVQNAQMGGYRVMLCGSSFGLNLRRHRWFWSNVAMLVPTCDHGWQTPRFRSLDQRRGKGALATVVGVHGHLNYPGELELRKAAMDIDWMPTAALSQAIPPAYTQFIGEQLLESVG